MGIEWKFMKADPVDEIIRDCSIPTQEPPIYRYWGQVQEDIKLFVMNRTQVQEFNKSFVHNENYVYNTLIIRLRIVLLHRISFSLTSLL